MKTRNIYVLLFFITGYSLLLPSECVRSTGHLTMLFDTYKICSQAKSLLPCLKLRSLLILDKLTKDDNEIPLVWNTLSLVKDADIRTGNRMLPLTQEELDASLPEEEVARDKTLDHLLLTALSKFVKSRTLQIKLPEVALTNFRDSFEEGRGKGGGGGGGGKGGKGDYAMMGMMMMGGTLMTLGFAGLAAMAGKALMISMMALMLSAILAAKKHGGGEHHGSSYEVIQVPSHGHSHHGRSFGDSAPAAGSDLAYRAYSYVAPPDVNALQSDTVKPN